MKRGQAAFEYMILIGALLAILIPLFNYVSYYSAQNVKVEKLEDAVQTLGKTADALYALGPGNRDYTWISLPGGMISTTVTGTEITLTAFLFNQESDFHYETIGPVNGTIPSVKGTFKMKLEVLDSGVVQIDKS
jgi:uncharacterized protein (UPF0333 family)